VLQLAHCRQQIAVVAVKGIGQQGRSAVGGCRLFDMALQAKRGCLREFNKKRRP
jgi:hypothetical protein